MSWQPAGLMCDTSRTMQPVHDLIFASLQNVACVKVILPFVAHHVAACLACQFQWPPTIDLRVSVRSILDACMTLR